MIGAATADRGQAPQRPEEFEALRLLSLRLGRDPTQVQGAGGNTSLKEGDVLFVKASGVWLGEVDQREGFVAVDRARLTRDFREDPSRTEDPKPYAMAGETLRPSIETTLHAALPQRVVLHTHSVDAIARLSTGDPGDALAALDGMDTVRPALVPYARPGLPLTLAVLEALREGTNVLLLGNHGVVVAADSVAKADALLWAVTSRLEDAPRSGPERDRSVDDAWRKAGYVPVPSPDGRAQHLATDAESTAIATSGSLYPDHVVFLGRGLTLAEGPGTLAEEPVVALHPGHGYFIRESAGRAAEAMALCLADVALRATGVPRPLSRDDEDALLGWDAEKHRQKLEAGR